MASSAKLFTSSPRHKGGGYQNPRNTGLLNKVVEPHKILLFSNTKS